MATARSLLKAFLDDRKIGVVEAARQLKVTHPALIAWIDGSKVPDHPYREAIEVWTSGAVPESSWATSDERRIVERVKPFAVPSKPAA